MPPNYVLPVQQALQGHPESPRIWSDHTHNILLGLNFKSCPHEPCLYVGAYNNQPLTFLRQVDDFGITSPSPEIADSFLDECTEASNHFQGGELYLDKNDFDFNFLIGYMQCNPNP